MPPPDPASCPDEAELAAFVARTLEADRRAAIEAHVDGCAGCRETIAHVAATEAETPRQIGRYRLDRVIGSGGMGVVWQAWDPALERGLAIKLLRPEVTDDHGRARLIREARALARLQHPNVVAVHDVGELAGELFIATELVDGEALDRWQRDRQPAEIIAAYAQAARGLAAAHRLGLVHRDVKPSNILVGRDGRVRVGDFGLAIGDLASAPTVPVASGATAREPRLTVDGAVVGTPAYMAPEQRDGAPVDARADQYSLCLALAEALLGAQPPADPTPAMLAERGVHAPWPAIARGLATRPDARHPSLAPLITALDGGRARSRPRLAMIAGAAALVVVGGIAIAVRATDRDPAAACAARRPLAGAWEPATRDRLAAAFAASKLAYAGDAARAVTGALDTWGNELVAEDRRACEDAATHRQPPEIVARRRACLDRVRREGVELVAGLAAPDDGIIQRAPATARWLTDASTCNTPAGLADQTVPADAAAAARDEAVAAAILKARTLRRLGKLPEARAAAEAAVADARAAALLPATASAMQELATILHAQGDAGAEQVLVDALAIAAEAHSDVRAAAISALLVEVVGIKGDVAAAERQARLARTAIIRAGNEHELEAVVERGLGRANQAAKHYAEAYDHYQKAEAIHTALGLSDDVDFDRRAQVAALGTLDRLDEANRINALVLASDTANLGPKHPSTIRDRSAGAVLLFKAGKYADAATALEQVIVIDEEVSGADSLHVTALRARLAAFYMTMGRLEQAEPLLVETVRVFAANASQPDELNGQRLNLAVVQILLGRYPEAEAALAGLIAVARAAKDDDMLALTLQNYADALGRDGKHADAVVAGREALAIDIRLFGAVSRRAAEAHGVLGNAYVGLAKRDAAEAEFRLAIEGFEAAAGADTAQLGEPLIGLGELHLARRDAAGARPILERAVAVLAGGDPVDLARGKFALARSLVDSGEPHAGVAAARAALELYTGAGDRARARRAEVERWLAARP